MDERQGRVRQSTDETEVEGHAMRGRAKPETDQQPQVEGHIVRKGVVPEQAQPGGEAEVEGHGLKAGRRQIDAVPTADEPEVEGHAATRRPPNNID